MPPRPRHSTISSWGNNRAISSMPGVGCGTTLVPSGPSSVPGKSVCGARFKAIRHRGQRPSGASVASAVPQRWHFRVGVVVSFITCYLSGRKGLLQKIINTAEESHCTAAVLVKPPCQAGLPRRGDRLPALWGPQAQPASAATRCATSSSISAGLETVWAICSRNTSRNRLRRRWTATRAAPSEIPSRAAMAP